jgi:hypothetical protein
MTQGFAVTTPRSITGVRPFGVFSRAGAYTGPYAAPHHRNNMLSHEAGWRGGLPLMTQGFAVTASRDVIRVRPFGGGGFH